MLVAAVSVETHVPAQGSSVEDYTPEMLSAVLLYLRRRAEEQKRQATKRRGR